MVATLIMIDNHKTFMNQTYTFNIYNLPEFKDIKNIDLVYFEVLVDGQIVAVGNDLMVFDGEISVESTKKDVLKIEFRSETKFKSTTTILHQLKIG